MSPEEEFYHFLAGTDTKPHRRSSIFEERISHANSFVDAGNEFFKKADFVAAREEYLKAAHEADFDYGQQWDMTPEHKNEIVSVKIRVVLNFVQCLLRLGEFSHSVKTASLGLDLCGTKSCDETSVAKLLYRRAKGNFELFNFEQTIDDLRKAAKIVPKDTNIRALLVNAIAMHKQQTEKSDNVWKGKSNIFTSTEVYPEIDLVISDPRNPAKTTNTAKIEQTTLWQSALFCCKRRQHLKKN